MRGAAQCVRRSAVQAGRYVLLRIGEVKLASEGSDAESRALHSLALALAASAVDGSALVASQGMQALATICPHAPVSPYPSLRATTS